MDEIEKLVYKSIFEKLKKLNVATVPALIAAFLRKLFLQRIRTEIKMTSDTILNSQVHLILCDP